MVLFKFERDVMNLKDALNWGTSFLKLAGVDDAIVDAGIILCYIINRDRAFLYAHSEYDLNENELEIYQGLVKKRSEGVPVQHITGRQEFMSLDFKVTPDTLIPRHDTEVLVETVMSCVQDYYGNYNSVIQILDMGTGSGCIAISLAYYIKNCHITAADTSEKALEVAQLNAVNTAVNEKITFVRSNLFESVIRKDYDIIVSNPPYIPPHEIARLQREVRDNEPYIALYGGEDGLDFYRNISHQASSFMKTGGILAFEVGYNQAEAVFEIMSKDYEDIYVKKDLSGIERVIVGRLKPGY